MNRRIETLTTERLRELLRYSPHTGQFVWRHVPSHRNPHRGMVAGTLNEQGYVRIFIDRRKYLAHRLAWLWVHGEWPPYMIDHENRDRTDNRIKNLRAVSHGLNIANGKFRRDNSTGFRGVYQSGSRFKAAIGVNKKFIYLGSFATAQEASVAYITAAQKYRPGFLGEVRKSNEDN
jgi:hypothetical protein